MISCGLANQLKIAVCWLDQTTAVVVLLIAFCPSLNAAQQMPKQPVALLPRLKLTLDSTSGRHPSGRTKLRPFPEPSGAVREDQPPAALPPSEPSGRPALEGSPALRPPALPEPSEGPGTAQKTAPGHVGLTQIWGHPTLQAPSPIVSPTWR
jgi:hypothetical protein